MSSDTLLDELTIISSVFSLDQSDLTDEEIVRRLKIIGRFLDKKATKDQLITFKDWITGILKNRYSEDASLEITDIIRHDKKINKSVSLAILANTSSTKHLDTYQYLRVSPPCLS